MDEFIECLKSYNMEDDTIAKILGYYRMYPNVDSKKIDLIYSILSYAGLSYDDIEKVIKKSTSILSFSVEQLREYAYVFSEIDDPSQIANSSYRIIDYKRVFIRNIVRIMNRDINNHSISCLFRPEEDVYGSTYSFSAIINHFFNDPKIASDAELEALINRKGLLKIDDKPVTVDEFLSIQGRRFYIKYKTFEYNKKNRKK